MSRKININALADIATRGGGAYSALTDPVAGLRILLLKERERSLLLRAAIKNIR